MPEFEGRQVVTLHNQRDFLFFRRHRWVEFLVDARGLFLTCRSYAFRSIEKAALQEIGPRFTLKMRWLKKGTPAVLSLGQPAKALELFSEKDSEPMETDEPKSDETEPSNKNFTPPTQDEFLWQWKVRMFLTIFLQSFVSDSLA